MTPHVPSTGATASQTSPRSRDAWLCVVALVVCELVVGAGYWAGARGSPAFSHWLKAPLGTTFTDVLQGCVWLLFALSFSRMRSIRGFVRYAGLRRPLALYGWCAAWVALAIAFMDGYGASRGWTAGSRHLSPIAHERLGTSWWFAGKAVLLVPFYEEVVTRGFLYRAFRSSHGVLLSTAIIICFSAFVHGPSVSRSLFTFGCLASLWVLLCVVFEWTGSLWGCLLCHGVYNAGLLHLWLPIVITLLLLVPFLASARAAPWQTRAFEVLNGSAEPDAPPNGGPATQFGNSGAKEGPPSVS